MAKAVIQANIQTQNGTVSVAPNAQIEIVDANTLTAVSLWEGRAGTVSKSNPFTAGANGFFRVYANSGRVNITATLDGRSQTWNDVILVSEVVGTVSQSGGVPTGAVIERGSNANGEYVKFADGTMICTGSVTLTYFGASSLRKTWTYPAAFAAVPATAPIYNAGSLYADSSLGSTEVTGCNTAFETSTAVQIILWAISVSSFISTDSCLVSCSAIGRWF